MTLRVMASGGTFHWHKIPSAGSHDVERWEFMHFPSRWYCCGISCVSLQRQLDVGLGSVAIVGQGALQSLLLPILLTIFFHPFTQSVRTPSYLLICQIQWHFYSLLSLKILLSFRTMYGKRETNRLINNYGGSKNFWWITSLQIVIFKRRIWCKDSTIFPARRLIKTHIFPSVAGSHLISLSAAASPSLALLFVLSGDMAGKWVQGNC